MASNSRVALAVGCATSLLLVRTKPISTLKVLFHCPTPAARMATDIFRDIDTPLVSVDEAKRFIFDCMLAAGASKKNSEIIADNLTTADYRGIYSHGMNRLEMYVDDVTSKTTNGAGEPKVLKETVATAWVDGCDCLGSVVGKFSMELAIKKAKEVGVGWVCAKNSNHYGISGWYAMMASKENLIGISMTNTSPIMCPTRAKDAALGTNPLSVAAPGKNHDDFVLDMATTAVAVGKIEIQKRKNAPIPAGWANDEDGQLTTDASLAYNASRLNPLGGTELTSGYKGFGLALMVESFCGILAGSFYGPNIRKWGTTAKVANLGQVFIAVNPDCFAPMYEDRMSDLMGHLRSMEPADPAKPVIVAGDPERMHMKAVDEAGGLRYVPDQMKTCEKLSKRLNIKMLGS